jgi:hypothetical protein
MVECQSNSTCRQKASKALQHDHSTPNSKEELLEANSAKFRAALRVPFVVDASGRRKRAFCRGDQLEAAG